MRFLISRQRRFQIPLISFLLFLFFSIGIPVEGSRLQQETATPIQPGDPSVIATPTPQIVPPAAETATPTLPVPSDTPTPLPPPTETPLVESTATPTETPTVAVVLEATDTPTPIELPADDEATALPVLVVETPAGEVVTDPDSSTLLLLPPVDRPVTPPAEMLQPNFIIFFDRILAAALEASAWIWLTCGSLLFFIVAGLVAGINFYRQEPRRYDLFDVEIPSRTPHPPDESARDDSWPSSLP